jgi:translation elongation factor EF-Ts
VLHRFLYSLWNKIATLVSLSAAEGAAEEVARNVAMQAAAMSPIALNEAVLMLQLSKRNRNR